MYGACGLGGDIVRQENEESDAKEDVKGMGGC